MIRVFTSEHDAWVLTAQIEALEGIPREGTTTWGEPLKHPTQQKWAVILSDLSAPQEGDVAILPSDWYPEQVP